MKTYGRLKIALPFILVIFFTGVFTACVAKNPRLAGAHLEKGIAYIQQGQYTPALKELLDAKQSNPNDPLIHYYLGAAYHGKKLNQDAMAAFKEAIHLKAKYSEAHNYLGIIYAEKGSWDQAIEEYKKAASNILYETPASAYNNMGYAYFKKGDYQAALASFDEAIVKDPNTALIPLIEKNRGMCYFAAGRIKEAIHHLEKSIEVAPDFPEAHYWLAECYIELKNIKAATEEYMLIIKTAPESEFGIKAKEGLSAIAASR